MGHIPSALRGVDVENIVAKCTTKCAPVQVLVITFKKINGLFSDKEGVVGYFNDSTGLGYGPGNHFMMVTNKLIIDDLKARGLNGFGAKEGVALMPFISGRRGA